MPAPYRHHSADFLGVPATQLRDGQLLAGLLIAAASAAGLGVGHAPTVSQAPGGALAAALLLGEHHLVVHADPARGSLLLDVVAPAARDSQRAPDVPAPPLTTRDDRSTVHERG